MNLAVHSEKYQTVLPIYLMISSMAQGQGVCPCAIDMWKEISKYMVQKTKPCKIKMSLYFLDILDAENKEGVIQCK